jgi:hypothetical protein
MIGVSVCLRVNEQVDTDGSGNIDFQEFLQVIEKQRDSQGDTGEDWDMVLNPLSLLSPPLSPPPPPPPPPLSLSRALSLAGERVCCLLVLDSVTSTPQSLHSLPSESEERIHTTPQSLHSWPSIQ